GFLAFVLDAVGGRVRRDGGLGTACLVGRHGQGGGHDPPACHSSEPPSLTKMGAGSARPSSMTERPASLKRPAANQDTARGRMMCSPLCTRCASESSVSPPTTGS